MTNAEMLELVKLDLGELNSDKDILIGETIEAAKEYIQIEGVTLDMDNAADADLVRMYAAYLFRKRASDKADGVGNVGQMPRMLRWALNNRVFKEHMKEA